MKKSERRPCIITSLGSQEACLVPGFLICFPEGHVPTQSLNGWIVGCLGPLPVARKYRKEALKRRQTSLLFKAHETLHKGAETRAWLPASTSDSRYFKTPQESNPLQQKRPRILRFMSVNQELMSIEAEHDEVLEAAVATKLRQNRESPKLAAPNFAQT